MDVGKYFGIYNDLIGVGEHILRFEIYELRCVICRIGIVGDIEKMKQKVKEIRSLLCDIYF